MMSDLFIAKSSAMVAVDGTPHRVRRGRTIAHPEHPIVAARPDLWRPLVVDHPAPGNQVTIHIEGTVTDDRALLDLVRAAMADQLPAAPAPAPAPAPAAAPAPKDVRAWAKKAGVDCPARGPLPDELVAAYQAAHTTEGS